MSGESFIDNCPRCGEEKTLYGSRDWKPYDQISAICLECGFRMIIITEIATLKEINEMRMVYDFSVITKKRKPLEKWIENGYESIIKKKT